MRRLISRLCLLTVAAVAIAVAPTAAEAHTASTYYPARWPAGTHVTFGYDVSYPTGAYRDRVYDGKTSWNNVAGASEPKIDWALQDGKAYGSFSSPCSMTVPVNGVAVFWGDLDTWGTAATGLVKRCTSGTTITKASLTLDSTGPPWYTGTGDSLPGTVDLQSVTVHEWGHVLGFSGHWTAGEATTCPSPAETVIRHVMCPSLVSGSEIRTLKAHDRDTFLAAY